jgi:hypothetical protein
MLARHGRDKSVAPAGVVGDVAPARAAIAERLAQRCDMDPQGAVIDDRVGPGVSDQLFLGYRFAGALDQCDQNVERTTTEAHSLSVVEQNSLRRNQPERSEGEGLFIHRENRPWERLLILNTRALATRSESLALAHGTCTQRGRKGCRPAQSG